MRKIFLLPLMLMIVCSAVMGQQAPQPQPLTFYYDYTVRPGQEEEFMTLVKTVGAPVRDKLMADGVVLAWGLYQRQTPASYLLLRLHCPSRTRRRVYDAGQNCRGTGARQIDG